jgi:hypothetical protein
LGIAALAARASVKWVLFIGKLQGFQGIGRCI